MTKTVSALKARQNLGQILEEVYYRGDQYIIERAGKQMAAVVPLWQVEERRKVREEAFGMIREIGAKNRKVKSETIEREVAEAIRAVRAQAHGRTK